MLMFHKFDAYNKVNLTAPETTIDRWKGKKVGKFKK